MNIIGWFLAWLFVGAVIGWFANAMLGTDRPYAKLGAVLVGIVGAMLGGVLSYLLGLPFVAGFNLWSLFVAAVVAIVLIVVLRMLSGIRAIVSEP
jgi:uncharacterized membrane protein YeaQ/YmgE (transglycosylase-associated protein family)